jgi:Transposase DDE domain
VVALSIRSSMAYVGGMSKTNAVCKIGADRVHEFVTELFVDDMHALRVLSLSNATTGAIFAGALGVHAIGTALADSNGLEPKHAIKQVDRLLSNMRLSVWDLFPAWVRFLLARREQVVVALDWTDFDDDGHATIALSMMTSHGRATPLMWKTHEKAKLLKHRNDYEDELLAYFREVLPPETHATVLADRGFGDQAIYKALLGARIDFVIRFRESIAVTDADGETRPARELVPANGRARKYPNAKVTRRKTPVPAVVCAKAKNMKESWCLATSRTDLGAGEIVALYGRRFTIEENFRDTKDPRFGMGLSATHVGRADRRDRLLLVGALAQALLTLLGAAAEEVGLDQKLKANTVKRRTHSLFNQGWYWYHALPRIREEWLRPLMEAFGRIVREQAACREIFGVI